MIFLISTDLILWIVSLTQANIPACVCTRHVRLNSTKIGIANAIKDGVCCLISIPSLNMNRCWTTTDLHLPAQLLSN